MIAETIANCWVTKGYFTPHELPWKSYVLMVQPPFLPSGKLTKNYGKSPFLMGKSTISMAIFNSFLYVFQAGYPPFGSRIHQVFTACDGHPLGAPAFPGNEG